MIKIFKSFVRNHFGFSKAETNGMVLLFPVILITIFSPFLINKYYQLQKKEAFFDEKSALKWKNELESSLIFQQSTKKKKAKSYSNIKKPKVIKRKFIFNPNKVSQKEIVALGFSERVARNWNKFLKAGGKFNSQKDLQKIYGMDSAYLSTLNNYLRFDSINSDAGNNKRFEKKKHKPFVLTFKEKNLNKTDSDDLKKISGIGEKLSERILKFRDKLGGFHSLEQLSDVYGLDSAVIHKISNHFHVTDSIHRFRINQVTEKELASHPYFSYKIAKVIINYREQHGAYKEPMDLKKIHIMSDSIISKISPYIQFDERSDIFNHK